MPIQIFILLVSYLSESTGLRCVINSIAMKSFLIITVAQCITAIKHIWNTECYQLLTQQSKAQASAYWVSCLNIMHSLTLSISNFFHYQVQMPQKIAIYIYLLSCSLTAFKLSGCLSISQGSS